MRKSKVEKARRAYTRKVEAQERLNRVYDSYADAVEDLQEEYARRFDAEASALLKPWARKGQSMIEVYPGCIIQVRLGEPKPPSFGYVVLWEVGAQVDELPMVFRTWQVFPGESRSVGEAVDASRHWAAHHYHIEVPVSTPEDPNAS